MASSRPRPQHPQPATRQRSKSRPPRPRTDRLHRTVFKKKGGLRAALFAGWRNCRGPAPPWYRRPGDSGRSMTEMTDDLSTPLGQKTERQKRRFRLPFTAMQALAVLLGLFLVAFLVVA